jgi:hypothetical protein
MRECALDCGLYYAKPQGLFSKIHRQSGILLSWPLDLKWMDWIESGTVDGGVRPAQGCDGEFRGGTIAGDDYLAIQRITSQKKYTSG